MERMANRLSDAVLSPKASARHEDPSARILWREKSGAPWHCALVKYALTSNAAVSVVLATMDEDVCESSALAVHPSGSIDTLRATASLHVSEPKWTTVAKRAGGGPGGCAGCGAGAPVLLRERDRLGVPLGVVLAVGEELALLVVENEGSDVGDGDVVGVLEAVCVPDGVGDGVSGVGVGVTTTSRTDKSSPAAFTHVPSAATGENTTRGAVVAHSTASYITNLYLLVFATGANSAAEFPTVSTAQPIEAGSSSAAPEQSGVVNEETINESDGMAKRRSDAVPGGRVAPPTAFVTHVDPSAGTL
jgi:hypothetical protein